MFIPPFAIIRRKTIIRKLKEHGAVCENTAVRMEDAGIAFPHNFRFVTARMLSRGIMQKTADGRYYTTI